MENVKQQQSKTGHKFLCKECNVGTLVKERQQSGDKVLEFYWCPNCCFTFRIEDVECKK